MNRRKIIWLVIVSLIVVTGLIYFANNWSNKLYADKITVKGNTTISEEEILKAAGIKRDSVINLDDINYLFIRDRILKHPEVKKVVVSKESPSELIIEITEKRPVAVVVKNSELFLIDDDYEIFSFKNFEKIYDLPVINGLKAENDPDYKKDLRSALNLIKEAYTKGKSLQNLISEVNVSDSDKLVVYTNDHSAMFYFPRPDSGIAEKEMFNEKLNLFKNFFDEEIMRKNLKFEYVDLRFSNQIIAKLKLI
jgi:cell division septal protein FtsQ